ncbi:hypothetical protein tloyanaT_17270 [Thalassotalea loyana]|uniref:PH domain-containing protein n=1 Tax=Thalassotalea loyana TaxID=280483 RepID=A0ABQ6HD99_9GAMM|nr:hypothetical protein [Thalassotalea loyana]GLX85475.1 hypothetical protein tloyanaT_17270 [Thalassotalea loyana]
MTHYQHKQKGLALLTIMAIAGIVLIIATHEIVSVMNATLALLIIVSVLFSSLTIYITDDKIGWHFGLKFWHKTLPLSDVKSARLVTTKWYYGLGIRLVPNGWLYIVSGNQAVELTTKTNKHIMIGTDDGERLIAQLSKQNIHTQ